MLQLFSLIITVIPLSRGETGEGDAGAAVGSALIASKTSFAKVSSVEDFPPPGLWEESESFLMDEDVENLDSDQSISTDGLNESTESNESSEFCSLLLVLRSILVALLLHLAILVYKRKSENQKTAAPKLPEELPTPRECASESTACGFSLSKLHIAAAEGNLEDLREGIKADGDVNCTDAWDETPLHLACRFGRLEACELLLEAKANVNSVNCDDLTPLAVVGEVNTTNLTNLTNLTSDCSSFSEHVAVAAALLRCGAVLHVSEDQVPRAARQALLEQLLHQAEPGAASV